ncbi:hypothetical protein GQ457_15G015490 [Hibiscus cannabinus]
MHNAATLGGIDARELSLVNDLVIPSKFKVPELEKFTGTTCPSAHLTMYCRKMSLYLDNEKLLIHCFQDSLVGSAARWYTQLSRAHIKIWRDLFMAFLEQYKHVSNMVPSMTVLQTMEQRTNVTFCQYAQRWRDVAAQVQPPLLENEITLLFVNTLKDDFYDRMLDHDTKPFADMVLTRELIQATIKSGRIRGGNDSRKFSKKRDIEVNTTSSYTVDHSAGIIVRQPNHVVTSGASSQNSSKQETKGRGEKKEKLSFTLIPIRHEELFPQLVESRLVVPRYIAPIQPPTHLEQLLKAWMLSFEAPEKNHMPNHKGVNAVIEGGDREVKENLADVTIPLKMASKTDDFCEYHQSEDHEIQECQEFRLVQAMMDNKELEFFTKSCDPAIEDVCMLDDVPTQGNFASLKPLVIKVGSTSTEVATATTSGIVIKAHAPFPYKDSKQVPWKYKCEVSGPQKTEENVNENTVRAFDGTQRDVLGKITVPLLIGPAEYEVDFVVMDIKPTYSCLLGRPWIHTAGAIPSTLHQKLKFVIDGKLVTVPGEEDIIATIATNTQCIETDEDAVECSFRSLELVSATFIEENNEIRRPKLSRCAKIQVWIRISTRPPGKESSDSEELGKAKSKIDRRGSTLGPNDLSANRSKLCAWGIMGLTNEDLSSYFENLTINAVTEGDEEGPYLEKIGPCSPEFELNNWIAEELLVIFKTNIE